MTFKELELLKKIYSTYESEIGIFYDKNEHGKYSNYKQMTNNLNNEGYIKVDTISTGIKCGSIVIIKATKKGIEKVKEEGGQVIIKEAEALKKQHSSYEHGYLIKKTIEKVKEEGILEVHTKHEETKMKYDKYYEDGKKHWREIRPDFDFYYNDTWYHVECETGKLTDGEIIHKIDKYAEHFNNYDKPIIVVCPNEKQLRNTIDNKITKWRIRNSNDELEIIYINLSKGESILKKIDKKKTG